jgi:DNA segregation ATPase FtsK/SpoIIIE-like protein
MSKIKKEKISTVSIEGINTGIEQDVLGEMKKQTKSPTEPKLETKIIMGHVGTGKYAYLQHFLHKYSKECKFLLVDGDKLHFPFYRSASFLLHPIVEYDWDKFSRVLRWISQEIDNRKEENKKEPKIALLVGQYAASMRLHKDLTEKIFIKIAKEGKDLGIYLIATTSRGESKEVVTDKMRKYILIENFDKYKK